MVNKDQVESWRESLYRVYKSGQQSMRVAVYGTKHDASLFEELLKQASQFQALGTIGDTMIDTACLNIPKVILKLNYFLSFLLIVQKIVTVKSSHLYLASSIISQSAYT